MKNPGLKLFSLACGVALWVILDATNRIPLEREVVLTRDSFTFPPGGWIVYDFTPKITVSLNGPKRHFDNLGQLQIKIPLADQPAKPGWKPGDRITVQLRREHIFSPQLPASVDVQADQEIRCILDKIEEVQLPVIADPPEQQDRGRLAKVEGFDPPAVSVRGPGGVFKRAQGILTRKISFDFSKSGNFSRSVELVDQIDGVPVECAQEVRVRYSISHPPKTHSVPNVELRKMVPEAVRSHNIKIIDPRVKEGRIDLVFEGDPQRQVKLFNGATRRFEDLQSADIVAFIYVDPEKHKPNGTYEIPIQVLPEELKLTQAILIKVEHK